VIMSERDWSRLIGKNKVVSDRFRVSSLHSANGGKRRVGMLWRWAVTKSGRGPDIRAGSIVTTRSKYQEVIEAMNGQ
jgi:hypothetical protein